ncbi:uncharacterized protein METZ01_LOCUS307621, partial [marine metagenome]
RRAGQGLRWRQVPRLRQRRPRRRRPPARHYL